MSEIKIKGLPDIGGMFAQMKVRDDLQALDHEKTILGYSIGLALQNKRPLGQILATILDWYIDNPEGAIKVVGEDLMNRILQLLKKKP